MANNWHRHQKMIMGEFNLSFAEWKALSNESKIDLMRTAQRRRIERQRERLVKTTAPSTTG